MMLLKRGPARVCVLNGLAHVQGERSWLHDVVGPREVAACC